ncbi:MAG: hypothetical protein L0L52_08570 [Staphylococcus equorum]|nr:hypothetical protein [Staphylococcus equorum]
MMIGKITKRLATLADLPRVLMLVEDGKKQMEAKRVTQWNKDYPTSDIVKADIQQRTLWLYGQEVEACVTVILEGNTLNICRLVVDSLYKNQGWANFILQDILDYGAIIKQAKQVKIVTNHSNQSMLKLLSTKDFIAKRSFLVEGRESYGSFIEFSHAL